MAALGIVYLSWYMRQPRACWTGAVASEPPAAKSKKALTGQWQDFKLAEKIEQSANVNLYKFALAGSHDTLGLPAGKHIQVQAECNGKVRSLALRPDRRSTDGQPIVHAHIEGRGSGLF